MEKKIEAEGNNGGEDARFGFGKEKTKIINSS